MLMLVHAAWSRYACMSDFQADAQATTQPNTPSLQKHAQNRLLDQWTHQCFGNLFVHHSLVVHREG